MSQGYETATVPPQRIENREIKMISKSKRQHAKRLGAMAVASSMLLQTAFPAYAEVSQIPGIFVTPPDANVMFTLDDSLSMLSDAIPDYIADQVKMPNADSNSQDSDALSGAAGQQKARFPGMWKDKTLYWSAPYYRYMPPPATTPPTVDTSPIARYLRSAVGNPLYYNPKFRYRGWPEPGNDANFLPDAITTAVNIHPYDPLNATFTRNLKVRFNDSGSSSDPDDESKNFWPATYYVYTGPLPLPTANPNNALNVSSNFLRIQIKPDVLTYAGGLKRTDCMGPGGPNVCTYAEELQNFANWLQYSRNRMLMAKGGVAAAFALQKSNLRVGFGTINSPGTVRQGVAKFDVARRPSFYTDLFSISKPAVNLGTPLRKAMDDVGQYFMRSNAGNPWADDPAATAVGNETSCRKSFHILSTDGYWNGPAAAGDAAKDNDAFPGNTPSNPKTGTVYTYGYAGSLDADPLVGRFTVDPFADAYTDTLADVAAYYWKSDLRALRNDVPSSTRDPAFWQHLSTYTVGLGVSGTGKVKRKSDGSTTVPMTEALGTAYYNFRGKAWLETQELRDALIANKEPMTWPEPKADQPETGDDLVHASMNGRGRYFSATDPEALKNGLAAALAEAGDTPGSLANVVTQSPQVSAGSAVYQATYNPAQWSGRFYAFAQAADGSVKTAPSGALWEASNKMPAPIDRKIFTWDPGTKTGSTFAWLTLTPAQQGYLGDITVLEFLRGSDANELAKGGTFRDRARYTVGNVPGGVLGDVVNGSPIKGPSAGGGYDKLPTGAAGQADYAAYRSPTNMDLDNMRNTLFLGANDGMLHAFDRTDGKERFAFVPNSVFNVPNSLTGDEKKLKMLSDPGYAHRFTVDGPPQIGDAFIGSPAAWKTVLVGSTGAGARSVFAMDVSKPATADFDKTKVLWEYSEANNVDVGYVTSYPHVARMRNGDWVAIFGNGYDSKNGRAKLFILNLQTGAVVWEQYVGDKSGGNGLSQPNFIVNNKREVTAIYAGDLKGNMWKFDVDNTIPSQWKVAFGGPPNYTPLFAGDSNQPITVMPELTFHPNGGTLVSFGTGELFKTEDTSAIAPAVPPVPDSNINLNTQALYGIWDKPAQTTGFSGNTSLVQQGANTALAAAADATAKVTGTTANTIDWSTKRGWFLNLGTKDGERVNVNPQQVNNVLLVVSNKPDSNPCKAGGISRLFALDPITGGAPDFAVFDSNGIGGITSADKGYNVKTFLFGVLSLPALQSKKPGTDINAIEKVNSRGQTAARLGGVENKTTPPTDCEQWLLAGGSDASIAGLDIATCKTGNPRISWRQLK
jgi:type IV pilus assembly protein PilY1